MGGVAAFWMQYVLLLTRKFALSRTYCLFNFRPVLLYVELYLPLSEYNQKMRVTCQKYNLTTARLYT